MFPKVSVRLVAHPRDYSERHRTAHSERLNCAARGFCLNTAAHTEPSSRLEPTSRPVRQALREGRERLRWGSPGLRGQVHTSPRPPPGRAGVRWRGGYAGAPR